MTKLFASLATTLVMSAPVAASASVININFEGFAYGTNINDYYNHGTDSLNRGSGEYYGITFSGGDIKATPRGNYLAGATTVTIDPAVVRSILGTNDYFIKFNGGVYYQRDERSVFVTYENGRSEPSAYIPGNDSPDCPVGGCGIYYGTMGSYSLGIYEAGVDIVRIVFPTDRLDNFQIRSMGDTSPPLPSIRGSYELDRDIPEPASAALFGIGVAGLLAGRRRNIHKPRVANR